ncbi:glycoside hydrolase family 2 protein [Streptomyces sp. NPDC054884]|uniref:glycoside hydrolase family 2 protein n=1 Tax=Streptomyces sp. ME08-AFT2 TaxID=3028683 RepID=UPI0029A6F21C|nr:glycoside hydrolase family 2 protein [Streptomyces sp. ME08-AFT2]MDX3312168.1 glycoside hydrolase family 2 protein [Streptomyces sp. ME08-AFT2]
MLEASPLDDGWQLRHEGRELPAVVPGCVHTDLLAAGVIPDPFLGRAETEVSWVGRREWTYETRLPAVRSGHEQTDLVFDGLDTVAEITLDGRLLGRVRNMHRSYRFDVTGLSGVLAVRFASAYVEAEAVRGKVGDRPGAYPEPYQYLRKMACSFGWDWGPTLVTAGIWRPVRVERWSTARLAGVRPLVTVEGGVGVVELQVDVERTRVEAGLVLEARVAGRQARAEVTGTRGAVRVEVPDADLWWPRGYGGQRLYDVELTLHHGSAPLDVWRRRIGFRRVELDTSADSYGSGFTLVVNGVRLFARGVNWIPDDVFPSRVTRERYRKRLRQAADAGVDLVRVWGGGIYESEDFYEACDESGLLVWQDFPFACAAYPEEQPLRGEVEAEARENVVRLMPHPSLVLWNGNNENLWGFRDWGWEERLGGDSWGEGYYLGMLPRVVGELDPTRPYTAGSPWSGSWERHPNDPAHGTHHSWEVWNRQDYAEYRSEVPRFVAEFGWQAPPAHATLRRALPGEELAADSPGMLHHQKAEDGNGKLERGLARHFPSPGGDFDRWHYLTQVNQARAVATGIEHWRSHWPVCAGTIVWQLNDCWPVTSWAAIDGDGREKPLYHELRRLYADRLLSLQVRDGRLVAAAVNQSAEPWTGPLTLRRLTVEGDVVGTATLELAVGARSVEVTRVPADLEPAGAKEFLVADARGLPGPGASGSGRGDTDEGRLRTVHFPVPDRDIALPRPEFAVDVTAGAVTVTARTLVRDLLLQADRLDPGARADRGLVTLLPGERVTIGVEGWETPDAAAARAALYCQEPLR